MTSPTAPRTGTSPVVQLCWSDGELFAWRADGAHLHSGRPATSSWRHPQADARVLNVALPGGSRSILAQRLEPSSLVAIAELDPLDSHSPAVRWIGALRDCADRLVGGERVVPVLDDLGRGLWRARWVPLADDLRRLAATLGAAMPPVLAAARPDAGDPACGELISAELLASFCDAEARRRLGQRGWLADIGDIRRPAGRAARLVTRALGAEASTFRADPQLAGPLRHLATSLDELAWRTGGEVVAGVRLRLGLPDGEENCWPLGLELVDRDDPARTIAAAELIATSAAAAEFAGSPKALDRLAGQLSRASASLAETVPGLAEWLAGQVAGIDVETAAGTLSASDQLAAAGIELIAPDSLVRRQPASRGSAQPGGVAGGRFSGEAIVQWTPTVDGQPIDQAAVERAAVAGASLIDVGGRWVLITASAARQALHNLERHRAEHAQVSIIDALRLGAELGDGDELVASGWLGELLDGLPDAALAEGQVPDNFAATLRPYQRRGLAWLQFLERAGVGGCLADDMGLGKTPTTLAHLAGRPGPHLVICPLSVIHNWEAEAARFVPLSRVAVHHGAGRRPTAVAELAAANDIVVSTYATVTRDVDALGVVDWSTVVLDEAQAIKNPSSHAARAVRQLPAGQRLALTGTPVENRLSELWSIMAFAVPGLLGPQTQFRARFATPIERHHDHAAAESLRALTAPFLLRRTKADRSLVPELPDKVEQVAWASLTHEQATMYQAVVDQLLADAQSAGGMRRRGLVLAALTRLKQICNHPAQALGDGSPLPGRSGKLARFDELIAQLLDVGDRALVFTQFREMGLLLARHCAERMGIEVPFLHGGTAAPRRREMVEQFQDGRGEPLLIVSLKAGGTGLNLTAASRVVHYDRWWNPAVEDQATDRAWRIGQQRSVFVHKLVCRGTIEERVDELIAEKRSLADAVIGTTPDAWLSELSTDELRDLVVLDHRAGR